VERLYNILCKNVTGNQILLFIEQDSDAVRNDN
jgi:hypothetical protein